MQKSENMVQVPVSLGELIDKYTILLIKSEKITDSKKLENVHKEQELLKQKIDSLNLAGIDQHIGSLKEVNLRLWQIEDDIRAKEKSKSFDDEFIQLARSVYITNDQRFEAKGAVNKAYGSELIEVKSYEDYK